MTTIKNVVHFVTTGTAKYMFNVGKELFFVPAIMILKSLSSRSDADIYAKLIQGKIWKDNRNVLWLIWCLNFIVKQYFVLFYNQTE